MDQRNCIKFCVKNEDKCARTFKILTVTFRESNMSRTQVQLWYNRFKESREEVNDNARSGRPSTSKTDENIEAVEKKILDNLLQRLLMMLAYCSGHAKQFLRMF